MNNIFQHKIREDDNNIITISPSQIANFFNYPSIWFNDNLTNNPKSFIGNTATLIGTSCHYIYEQFGKNPEEFVANKIKYFEFVDSQLKEYIETNKLDVDIEKILTTYPLVAKTVVNEYITKNLPTQTECSIYHQIKDNILLGGTIDNVTERIIVDYKNVSTKPSDLSNIPFHYKIQLLAYKWLYETEFDRKIDTIRIVYGVLPTKTLPARCYTVTETVSKDDEEMFRKTLELIVESIRLCKKNKSLIPYIFKSMDLEGSEIK